MSILLTVLWYIGRIACVFLLLEGLSHFAKLLTDKFEIKAPIAYPILILTAVSVLVYIAVDMP